MMQDLITRIEFATVRHCSTHKLMMMSRIAVGVIPPFGSLVMLLHCILLVAGFQSTITQWVFDCSAFGFVAWILISLAFGFCWVHRAFISYGVFVTFCIDWQRTIGFGAMLHPLRWTAVIIGVTLFVFFIRRQAWMEFAEHNINRLK